MSTEGTSSNATAELPILSLFTILVCLSSLRRSSLFYVINNNMQKEKGNGSALQNQPTAISLFLKKKTYCELIKKINQPTAMVGVEFDIYSAYHIVLPFEGLVI